jgi:CheY-like chemotaxis protein
MPIDPELAEGAVAVRRRLQVLVVEDHPGTRKAVQLLLRWLECDPHPVDNGWEAVQAVRAREYDLILMDVMMPVMDGLEATRRIRAEQPRGTGPRIVAMSGDATRENREICLHTGMDEFLAKPFAADALARILEEAVVEPALGR